MILELRLLRLRRVLEGGEVATRSVFQPREAEAVEIQELYRLFRLEKTPALVGPSGDRIPLPESIFKILLQVANYMRQGKAVSVIPVMQELTTQQAAHHLGVSRPHVIELLESGRILFHKVGTHRRIYLKDLLDYCGQRDRERSKVLTELARESLKSGLYDASYVATNDVE